MEDIAEELARRDRFIVNLRRQQTYEERLAAMRLLQRRAWALLKSNPEGYARFLRRNYKARATDIDHEHER